MMRPSVALICLSLLAYFNTSAQFLSTRVVTGKGVYIFGPSLAEADTLALDQGEALNDFSYYSNKIASFVRARGLPCEYISERTIKIRFGSKGLFTISRDSVEFGTILTDGKNKPLLLKYVSTDVELDKKCNEYFNLK
jgi:hypothetical protein